MTGNTSFSQVRQKLTAFVPMAVSGGGFVTTNPANGVMSNKPLSMMGFIDGVGLHDSKRPWIRVRVLGKMDQHLYKQILKEDLYDTIHECRLDPERVIFQSTMIRNTRRRVYGSG